jgi:hypothetical protein
VENPTGGVVLVGGQSGTVILDTLYRLSSLGPESGTGSGSGSKWEKMEQRLKMPRRFHTALMVPTSMTDCQTERTNYYYYQNSYKQNNILIIITVKLGYNELLGAVQICSL